MIKKTLILFALSFVIISCNKTATETKEFKTAYIDTSKLMEESIEAKDIEAKYKDKSKVMGNQLEAEVAKFKAEAASFKQNALTNGQAWAQQKGSQLQQREQELNYAQQAMLQQLQQESSIEMDSLVKNYRKIIKDFGKEKGYDYIYGSGETSPSILFAKDSYDITSETIKKVNEKYKLADKNKDQTQKDTEVKK